MNDFVTHAYPISLCTNVPRFLYVIAWLEQEYRKKAQVHERRVMSASIARQQANRILKAQVEANRPASANVLPSETSAYLKRPQSSSSQLKCNVYK